jgi:hypothetical protein
MLEEVAICFNNEACQRWFDFLRYDCLVGLYETGNGHQRTLPFFIDTLGYNLSLHRVYLQSFGKKK